MGPFEPCASYLTGKPVLGWRVGEWLENRCSRKVFHTGVPTLATDFSLGGLAWLPVGFSGLPLYALLRGTCRPSARRHAGTRCFPTHRPRATRLARSCGRSAWTARSPGHISTPLGRVESRAGRTQIGVFHPEDEALGRSHGGLSTKLHLSCDGRGCPPSVVVTSGQRHESTQLKEVLDAARVPRTGKGRPRKRLERLIADRGYSFPSCRRLLRRRRIPHTIPEPNNQQPARAPSGSATKVRPRGLPQAQLGGEVREPTQAVAGVATRFDENGGELPGCSGNRLADDLGSFVNHQAHSRPSRCYAGLLAI
jgi:hypothetical protein